MQVGLWGPTDCLSPLAVRGQRPPCFRSLPLRSPTQCSALVSPPRKHRNYDSVSVDSPGPEPLTLPPSAPGTPAPLQPAEVARSSSSTTVVAQASTSSARGALYEYTVGSYSRAVERKPVVTKALTSLAGFIVGDILAQRLGGGAVDVVRCLRLGAYGFLLDGPVGHWWYEYLERTVSPDKPKSTAAVLLKTAADQIVWAPVMTCVFFAFLKVSEGQPEAVMPTIQAKLVQTVVANYVVWPLAHFINFRLVPSEYRILYNNCVSVFWTAYLSTLSHAPVLDTEGIQELIANINSLVDQAEVALESWTPAEQLSQAASSVVESMQAAEGARELELPKFRLEVPRSIPIAPWWAHFH